MKDPHFDDGELLFHAIDPFKIFDDGEGRMPQLEALRFPDFSVNRSKYSEPGSVLVGKRSGWEAWQIRVDELPPQFVQPREHEKGAAKRSDTFTFPVEHVPLFDNYAHSEVRTFKNGERHLSSKPDSVKKIAFREHLRRKFRPTLE